MAGSQTKHTRQTRIYIQKQRKLTLIPTGSHSQTNLQRAAVLATEFPYMPIQYVKKILREKKRLYHAYLALRLDETLVEKRMNPYVRLKNRRNAGSSRILESLPGVITREFNAAKEQAQKLQSKFYN